jgi:hypothetical protein
MFGQTESSGSIDERAAAAGTSDRLEVVPGPLDPTAVRFTPPPQKPLPEIPVEASVVIQKPTHSITLVRGAPSTLPDIPPPSAPVEQPAFDSFPPQAPCFLLGLSVTIYDRALSQVKWQDPQTNESFEAWCGWDWNLLAPMQEVSCDKVTYHLFFSPWEIDTSKVHPALGRQAVPEHPKLDANQFVLVGGAAEAATGTLLLAAIQRYVVANQPQLAAMRAARDQYRADAEAWRKAHPAKPQNHTIVLRPHRGSRYLKDVAPAASGTKTSTKQGAR